MIKLLSVPHTGTRFTSDALEAAGLVRVRSVEKRGDFVQVHFDGTRNHPMIYSMPGPVIVSLRDRDEVVASWKRRGKDLREFERMWSEMLAFMETADDVHTLHVDNPDIRDKELAMIGQRFGIPLAADFSVKVGEGR